MFSRLSLAAGSSGPGADDYQGLEFTDELAEELVGLALAQFCTWTRPRGTLTARRRPTQALAKLRVEDRARPCGTKILPNSCDDVPGHVEAMLEGSGRLDLNDPLANHRRGHGSLCWQPQDGERRPRLCYL